MYILTVVMMDAGAGSVQCVAAKQKRCYVNTDTWSNPFLQLPYTYILLLCEHIYTRKLELGGHHHSVGATHITHQTRRDTYNEHPPATPGDPYKHQRLGLSVQYYSGTRTCALKDSDIYQYSLSSFCATLSSNNHYTNILTLLA